MKHCKLFVLALALFAAAACKSDDDIPRIEQDWNTTVEWVSRHNNFDRAAVPAKLISMGIITSKEEWLCRNGKLYTGPRIDPDRHNSDGGFPAMVVFFEDNTCRNYWIDELHFILKYHIYNWSYDEKTATFCITDPDPDAYEKDMKAQVKAISGNRIVFDGNLCGAANIFGPVNEGGDEDGYGHYPDFGIYLRLVMTQMPEEMQREWFETAVCDNPL